MGVQSFRLLVLGGLAGAMLMTACATGSGDIVIEERTVGSFSAIDASGGVEVLITVDPNLDQEVVVHYDDNLLENVVTEVRGDTLHIHHAGSINIVGGGRYIEVTANSLDEINASGGSDVTAEGQVDSLRADASGGSDVNLADLLARDVTVNASGGADVEVYASESINGSASGGSDVRVYGNPARMSVGTSGGADVETAP